MPPGVCARTPRRSRSGAPEYQCRPHSAPHQWRGLGRPRILKEQDPLTRGQGLSHPVHALARPPVFMDGRPHPPAFAPHSWTGFSTGEWIGNTLKITSSHFKDGYLKRGGPQASDMYTMTEFITRHGELLTIVSVTDDPVYLGRTVQSTTYQIDPTATVAMETCNGSAFAENGGSNRHHVPHFLPGENADARAEWLQTENWIPPQAALGGVKTICRNTARRSPGRFRKQKLTVPASKSAIDLEPSIAAQAPRDGEVHVLPVQGNVYMLVVDGQNVAASVGRDGVLIVNTGAAHMTEKLQAALKDLATRSRRRRRARVPGQAARPRGGGPARTSTRSSVRLPRRGRCATSSTPARRRKHRRQREAGRRLLSRVQGFGAAVTNVGRGAAIARMKTC